MLLPDRPQFATPQDFGLWALNASDAEVSMDQKIRAMQAMMAHAGKQPKAAEPVAPVEDHDEYAPRQVRSYAVVAGGKR